MDGKLKPSESNKHLVQYHSPVQSCLVAQGSTSLTSPPALPPCSGNPPPEVIWLHNGNEIQESEDFHFEQRGTQHSLCIQEVFPEDTGTYTCEAWNSAGGVRTQAVLTVQGEAAQRQGGGAALVSPKVIWRQGNHVSLLCPLVPSQPQRPAPHPTSQALAEWGQPSLPSEVPVLSGL